jgi:hypothetical protein
VHEEVASLHDRTIQPISAVLGHHNDGTMQDSNHLIEYSNTHRAQAVPCFGGGLGKGDVGKERMRPLEYAINAMFAWKRRTIYILSLLL